MEGIKDIGVTGNFEITLMNTRQVIHSKTTQGLGKCESPEERSRLYKIIRVYLDYAAKKRSSTKK